MSFVDFARAHGVDIDPGKLSASERIRRCGTVDKPKSTNGAWYWDGSRGWVFNWAAEAKAQWWNDPQAKPWTEAEKSAWTAKRKAMDAQQKDGHRRAAIRAAELIKTAVPGEHNYLHMKGFEDALGMVLPDGALLVPMRNFLTNELQGVQLIRWVEEARKYEKKMIPGMRAKGAVFRIGSKAARETFLVEGYATGLSVEQALRSIGSGTSVLVCFSAHNMEFIAQQVKGVAFVFADNDQSGTGEESAKATGLPYCMADEIGMDANDLHRRDGLMSVCKKIMEVRRSMRC
jgi:putative DNA primase/helicase